MKIWHIIHWLVLNPIIDDNSVLPILRKSVGEKERVIIWVVTQKRILQSTHQQSKFSGVVENKGSLPWSTSPIFRLFAVFVWSPSKSSALFLSLITRVTLRNRDQFILKYKWPTNIFFYIFPIGFSLQKHRSFGLTQRYPIGCYGRAYELQGQGGWVWIMRPIYLAEKPLLG